MFLLSDCLAESIERFSTCIVYPLDASDLFEDVIW